MNKVILLGRLVADPETRYTQSNIAMTRFKIAVNRPGKPQEGQPTADFFNLTAWRSTAEFVAKYFKKGQQVLVEGYLRNNTWTDQQGNKRYSDDIHVEQVYFADSKRDSSNNVYAAPPVTVPPFQAESFESGDGFYALSEDDEDLPF
ncbi:MAG: single-stranded DNA-binding protein [Clostridiaceae bacterium]|nr:single-stranded DNA-binding protein [Clostridiaceae bacterium]